MSPPRRRPIRSRPALPARALPARAAAAPTAAWPTGCREPPTTSPGGGISCSDLLTFLSAPPRTRRLAAVTGPPGSGTTTLALQAAHTLASRYRDGVALLPLCRADGVPRTPADLAADLLGRLAAPAGTGETIRPGPARGPGR